MKWPGVIPSGTICNQITGPIDILPTIAAIAGTGLPGRKIDGISVLLLLQGDFENTIRNEYYYYSGRSLHAVRLGNWKLVFPHTHASNAGQTDNPIIQWE